MANYLHFGRRVHVKTVMAAYSNDTYEDIPFSCDARLATEDLERRITAAIYKKFPPFHWGGCGNATHVVRVNRTSPTAGVVSIMHYAGIGD